MCYVHNSLLITLLALPFAFVFARADTTIKVSEDVCDKVYDLYDEIDIVYRSSENPLKEGSQCLIEIKSAFANQQICIRRNAVPGENRFCSLVMYRHFGSEKPKPWDLVPFNCNDRRPTCSNSNKLYTLFKYTSVSTIANITIDLTIYLQEITTTTERATTTYKSPRGKFDPVSSLLIPIGIVAGVCGATCLVICCVVCARCCKENDTAESAENNEELHELTNLPAIVPSAPEADFNPILQQRDPNIQYNHTVGPPGYSQALLADTKPHPSSKYSAEENPATLPNVPPPPYSSI